MTGTVPTISTRAAIPQGLEFSHILHFAAVAAVKTAPRPEDKLGGRRGAEEPQLIRREREYLDCDRVALTFSCSYLPIRQAVLRE